MRSPRCTAPLSHSPLEFKLRACPQLATKRRRASGGLPCARWAPGCSVPGMLMVAAGPGRCHGGRYPSGHEAPGRGARSDSASPTRRHRASSESRSRPAPAVAPNGPFCVGFNAGQGGWRGRRRRPQSAGDPRNRRAGRGTSLSECAGHSVAHSTDSGHKQLEPNHGPGAQAVASGVQPHSLGPLPSPAAPDPWPGDGGTAQADPGGPGSAARAWPWAAQGTRGDSDSET